MLKELEQPILSLKTNKSEVIKHFEGVVRQVIEDEKHEKEEVKRIKATLAPEEKEPFDFEKYLKMRFPEADPKKFDKHTREEVEIIYYLEHPEFKTISQLANYFEYLKLSSR
ncbi:MAG: hypothetical protein WAV56_04490 [Microgenomates group bacterium]